MTMGGFVKTQFFRLVIVDNKMGPKSTLVLSLDPFVNIHTIAHDLGGWIVIFIRDAMWRFNGCMKRRVFCLATNAGTAETRAHVDSE